MKGIEILKIGHSIVKKLLEEKSIKEHPGDFEIKTKKSWIKKAGSWSIFAVKGCDLKIDKFPQKFKVSIQNVTFTVSENRLKAPDNFDVLGYNPSNRKGKTDYTYSEIVKTNEIIFNYLSKRIDEFNDSKFAQFQLNCLKFESFELNHKDPEKQPKLNKSIENIKNGFIF